MYFLLEVKARRDMKKAVQTKKHIKSKKRVRRQSGRVRVIQMTDIHVQPEYMVVSYCNTNGIL